MWMLMLMALSPWPQFMHDVMHTGKSSIVVPDTVEIKWVFQNLGGGVGWMWMQPVVDDSGNIYYGNGNYFVSVDTSGNLRWSRYTEHTFGGPAAIRGDTVYFACSEGAIYAYTLSGNLIWQFPLIHPVNGGPTVANDGTIYIGDVDQISEQGKLYAINPNGTQKWVAIFDSSGGWYTTPALSPDEQTVYVTPGNWSFYAVNSSDGSIKWSYLSQSAFNIQYSSPSTVPLDGNHLVLFGDLGSFKVYARWYALDKDGNEKWQVLTDNSIQNTASYNADAGLIYLGSNDGVLRAVDTLGNLIWSKSFGCYISDPVIDGEGKVLLGTENGYFYILDGITGNTIFQLYIGMNNVSTPIIGENGKVYVIAGNGNLVYLGKTLKIAEKIKEDFGYMGFSTLYKGKILLPTYKNFSLKIYDINGRILQRNMSSGGVYFMKGEGKERRFVRKVILMK